MSEEKAGFNFEEIIEPTKPGDLPPAELAVDVREWYVVVPFKMWQHDRDRVQTYLSDHFHKHYGVPVFGFDQGPRHGALNSKISIRVYGYQFHHVDAGFVAWDHSKTAPREMKK